MGGAASSCLSPADDGPHANIVYQTPAPTSPTSAAGLQPETVRLAFAYASRPGTLSPGVSASASETRAFAARRQPLKANQDVVFIRPSYGGCPFLHAFGIFDGHGSDGGAASRVARDRMEALLLQELRHRAGGDLARVGALSTEAVTEALKAAFLGTERALGRTLEVDDSFSGTTAVVVLFIGFRLFAASVGDSRAVLGPRRADGTVSVDALTWDHNPYRASELERIEKAGGVVLSYEEMASVCSAHGAAAAAAGWRARLQYDQQQEQQEQQQSDALAQFDPPRVWDRTLTKPGACFTRSLGDSFAKTLGAIATPEVTCRELQAGGEYLLCIGSDGVFEFLGNEALLALVAAHRDRLLHACRTVCARTVLLSAQAGTSQETPAERERRELLYHHRDDTTLICVNISTQPPPQQQKKEPPPT